MQELGITLLGFHYRKTVNLTMFLAKNLEFLRQTPYYYG